VSPPRRAVREPFGERVVTPHRIGAAGRST